MFSGQCSAVYVKRAMFSGQCLAGYVKRSMLSVKRAMFKKNKSKPTRHGEKALLERSPVQRESPESQASQCPVSLLRKPQHQRDERSVAPVYIDPSVLYRTAHLMRCQST